MAHRARRRWKGSCSVRLRKYRIWLSASRCEIRGSQCRLRQRCSFDNLRSARVGASEVIRRVRSGNRVASADAIWCLLSLLPENAASIAFAESSRIGILCSFACFLIAATIRMMLAGSRAFKHEHTRNVFIEQPRDLYTERHTNGIDAPSKTSRPPAEDHFRSLKCYEGEAPRSDIEAKYSLLIGFGHELVLSKEVRDGALGITN